MLSIAPLLKQTALVQLAFMFAVRRLRQFTLASIILTISCVSFINTSCEVVRVHPVTGWKSVYVNPGEFKNVIPL